MFTGIVKGTFPVHSVELKTGSLHFDVILPNELKTGIEQGASVSIDGVCLTVARISDTTIGFDVINETLQRTTLQSLEKDQLVNVERSAKLGDEIGGHLLSGHIFGTASIHSIDRSNNNCVLFLRCPKSWTKYMLPKGYIALNGASLTLVDVDQTIGLFSVHLIPETLQKTTFGLKNVGDLINVELDSQTQAIVDTIERLYASKSTI